MIMFLFQMLDFVWHTTDEVPANTILPNKQAFTFCLHFVMF